MTTPSFVEANARSRDRLRALVARISDRELERELGGGWTVAAALAHVAFWDQRALVLLRRWKLGGVGPSPIDIDATNDAILPLCLALPPRTAAALAVSSAEAVDRELEGADREFVAALEALGSKFRLNRGTHRDEHIAQIEAVLGSVEA